MPVVEGTIGALPAKLQSSHYNKGKKKNWKKSFDYKAESKSNDRLDYPPCLHQEKLGHPPYKCQKRPNIK